MEDFLTQLGLFLQVSLQLGTPLLLGTVGAILNEKAGHLNLGVEGIMLMGAVMGFQIGCATSNVILAILAAALAGGLAALIYAFITVTLRGNQTVTGLVLTIFGTGLSSFLGSKVSELTLPENIQVALAPRAIPVLKDIPVLGPALFDQKIYVYLGLAAAIIVYFYLTKTRQGLNLRAVGENPAAADASGINVSLYKYTNIVVGGMLCGVAGSYFTISNLTTWKDNVTTGMGWIAVALVIFATWNPLKAIFGAYFFGMLYALPVKLQNLEIAGIGKINIPPQLLNTIPYIMTIIVLVVITMKKKKENQPPAGLSSPYFREDR